MTTRPDPAWTPRGRRCALVSLSAAGAILAASLLAGGGCASMRRPHARLSPAVIADRIEDEFPIGTSRADVVLGLQRRGAQYDSALPLDDPPGWSSLRIFLDQPWWAGLEWAVTYRKTEAWADMVFDETDTLREVLGELRERTW